MNFYLQFGTVLGLVIGWLIHAILDIMFWSKRRVCTEFEDDLKASVNELEAEKVGLTQTVQGLQGRIKQIPALELAVQEKDEALTLAKTQFSDRELHIAQLQTDVSKRDQQLTSFEQQAGQLQLLRDQLDQRDLAMAQLQEEASVAGSLRHQMKEKDQELSQMTDLSSRMSDLELQVKQREAEYIDLRDKATIRINALENAVSERDDRFGKLKGLGVRIVELEELIRQKNARIVQLSSQAKPDDLTKIRGIGPKISGIWSNRSVKTFDQLATASVSDVETVTAESGMRFRTSAEDTHTSWTNQATLASAGDWDGLKSYQKELRANQKTSNNLQKIWGISAKVDTMLRDAGITTFAALAAADADQIDEALTYSARYYNMEKPEMHESWLDQARLANAGKWARLRGFIERYRNRTRQDDLQRIWGIDNTVETSLHKLGVYTYAQLASAEADQLNDLLLEVSQPYEADVNELYEVWVEQALLANAGNFVDLDQLQANISWAD